MDLFVKLTSDSLVASGQIVSIKVQKYMFQSPLKDLTDSERTAIINSPNIWGVEATLKNEDRIPVASGLTKDEAKNILSELVVKLNNQGD